MEEEIIKQVANFGVALSLPAIVCYYLYQDNRRLVAKVDELNVVIRDMLIRQIESENSKTNMSKELVNTLSEFMLNVAVKRVEDSFNDK
jgi:KaiC/GvpD/RAD55 family RecA-like ATPase